MSELSRGQKVHNPLLHFVYWDVETGGDDSALVQSSVKVNDDLAITGIIDDLELVDVSVLLHDLEELNEGLGDWSQDNL